MKQRTLTKSGTVSLHRKEYLQPFENSLSLGELDGLDLTVVSVDEKRNLFAVRNHVGLQSRIDRLAYYDWFVNGTFKPTVQACREGARPDADSPDTSFPRRRMLRFAPHNFHKYRGKFFPQLVRSLSNLTGLEEGSTVMDPMCGSGTTLVEARALRMRAFGLDKNPLSVLISKVKTDSLSWDEAAIRRARNYVMGGALYSSRPDDAWEGDDLAYLGRWFSQAAIVDIAGLVAGIRSIADQSIRDFASVCLSDVVRAVSYQKEDELRVRKEVRQYRQGDAIVLFRKKCDGCLDSLTTTARTGTCDAEFDVREGDARSMGHHFPDLRRSVDVVITSPPYATALPYLDADRLSLIILGLLPRREYSSKESEMIGSREITERKRADIWATYEEGAGRTLPESMSSIINDIARSHHSSAVGFRKRNLPALLVKYLLDMTDVLAEMKKMLKHRSPAFVVIGSNSTRIVDRRVEIPTDRFLAEIAEGVGFAVDPVVDMELLPSNDVFKKNSGSAEKIIMLTKR